MIMMMMKIINNKINNISTIEIIDKNNNVITMQ